MGRGDEIDKQAATRFAWRLVKPGDVVELPSDEPASEPAGAGGMTPEFAAAIAVGRAEWHALSLEIARAWAMTDAAAQARATAKLAKRAAELNLAMAASQNDPQEAVRLARLFVRHFPRLSRAARDDAESACLWLDLSHAEANDLVLEVVRAGNERIGSALSLDPDQMETIRPDLSRELATLLNEAKTWPTRVLALEWLGVFGDRDAIPAARRALRLPHMGVRLRAIRFLLELDPPALGEADVKLLLEDAALHGAPFLAADDSYETASAYASALLDAVAAVRPSGGEDALLAIAEGNESFAYGDDTMLDQGWAIEALAAAYPDDAFPLIDRALDSPVSYERTRALDAAARLPLEEARPLLLRAAADGCPRVATRAREIWLERESRPCPVDELAGVPVELLGDTPPSERMRSRLIVLRAAHAEARQTMVDVLLEEAPDREALALLIFAVADDDLSRGSTRKHLPQDTKAWARELVRRFGAQAIEGLRWLSGHYPGIHGGAGWLHICSSMLDDGSIKPADAGPLREEAAERLASEAWEGDRAPADILVHTGAPPALFDRLWSIVMDGDYELSESLPVSELLIRWPDDGALDARLRAELEAALLARDFERFGHVARVALGRKAPGALDLAERLLAYADDEDAESAVQLSARALREAGRLPDSWLDEALSHAESPRFIVAMRLLPRPHGPRYRALLERTLTSTDRGGATAVEVASFLLFADPPLRPNDARLMAILARASPRPRAELACTLLAVGARTSSLEPHLVDLLASTDPVVIDILRDNLWGFTPHTELLRRLVSRVADADVRAEIEEVIGPAAPFWQDGV